MTVAACCDLHGRNCEPPSELCCHGCTEAAHPAHADSSTCSNPDLSSRYPDKIAAAWERGDAKALLRMTFASLGATEAGEYCECETPTGEALTCGHCLRRSKSAELVAVHRIVDAHEFVPGKLRGLMCAMCTQTETDPRHHGTPAIGRTSWGESVQGVVAG